MIINQYEIWIADLEPRSETESGKVRPVVVIQTELLNNLHPSTIVCPITTNVNPESEILRVHLKKGTSNLKEDCDILIDQIRAIYNKRFSKRLGKLPENIIAEIKNNISAVLDL